MSLDFSEQMFQILNDKSYKNTWVSKISTRKPSHSEVCNACNDKVKMNPSIMYNYTAIIKKKKKQTQY